MPNWTFLAVHFVHTLALALWIGGTLAIDLLASPVIRARTGSGAAGISIEIDTRFHRLLMGCIVALVITSAMMIFRFGRWSPWYAIQYVCIGMMGASAFFSYLVIGPRLRAIRRRGSTDDARLRDLNRSSELARQFNLACACVALFFS